VKPIHPCRLSHAFTASLPAVLVLLGAAPGRNASAQGLLSEIGAPGAREQLADTNPRVRRAALESLIRTADSGLCPWLARQIANRDAASPTVPALLQGLGRLRCRRFAPLLWHVVRESGDPARVRAAIDALGRMGDPRALPHLVRLANTGQAVMPAVEALARLGEAGARALRRLAGSSPLAAAEALRVLVAWRLPGHEEALRKALLRAALAPEEILRVLSETRNPSFRAAVVPYLFHPDHGVQIRALSVLERIGTREQAAAVTTLLSDTALRETALRTLVQIGARRPPETTSQCVAPCPPPPTATTPLLSLIGTGRGETRSLATTALGRLGSNKSVPPLAWLAEHGTPRLRAQAVRALQYVHTSMAALVLRRILRRGGPLAPLAAISLGSLLRAPAGRLDRLQPLPPPLRPARRAAISELLSLLRGRDRAMRIAAIRALGRIRAMAAQEALIRLLRPGRRPPPLSPGMLSLGPPGASGTSADVSLRRAAAEALARFRDHDAARALTSALQRDSDPGVRAASALSLASVGSSWPVTALVRSLSDAPWAVALNASYALGRLGYRGAAPSLAALLRSPNADLRANAALALGRLRYTPARTRLERLARADPSPVVRRAAGTALAWSLGKEAEPALQELLRMETEPDLTRSLARFLAAARTRRPHPLPPRMESWVDFTVEPVRGRPRRLRAYQLRLPTGDSLCGYTDLLGLGGAELIPEGEVDVNLMPLLQGHTGYGTGRPATWVRSGR